MEHIYILDYVPQVKRGGADSQQQSHQTQRFPLLIEISIQTNRLQVLMYLRAGKCVPKSVVLTAYKVGPYFITLFVTQV